MTTTTDTDPSKYVIPEPRYASTLAFLWPLLVAAIALVLLVMNSKAGIIGHLADLILFSAIPIFVINCFVQLRRGGLSLREIRMQHDYAWYRSTFPAHAHSQGRVSCRHCEGRNVAVRNLMNRSFMRAHACSQCGQTLYYSSEK